MGEKQSGIPELNNRSQLEQLLSEFGTYKKVAKHLNCGKSTVWDAAKRLGLTQRVKDKRHRNPDQTTRDDIKVNVKKDEIILESKSTEIKTGDELVDKATNLLRKLNVHLPDWQADETTVNQWDVTMKMGYPSDCWHETVTNYQVKVRLKKKQIDFRYEALKELTDNVQKHGFKIEKPKLIKQPKRTEPHMLEISIYDYHMGKLAWSDEVGLDWDLDIAAQSYLNAIEDALDVGHGFYVDEILFPFGHDYLHIDNDMLQTFRGTPQDVDGRPKKIFRVGAECLIKALNMAGKKARTRAVFIPGNHDPTTGFYLAEYLKAWFRNQDNVIIESESYNPRYAGRQYFKYGTNLIGMCHGQTENEKELPITMATEVPDLWATSTWREWHTGHKHRVKEIRYVSVIGKGTIIVRALPSLTRPDKWHYEHLFVGNPRMAEVHVWGKDSGHKGYFDILERM